ncbi:MAG: pilus assembly protein PilM [Gammaproteobacteria bacterium]|nr:pilus assembly protein PilM [Gammaproteobacteria bacterium]
MSFLSRILQKETTPEVHNNQPGLIGLDLGSHTLHLCQLRPKSHRHYTIMAKASMGFEGSRQQLLDDPKAFKRLLAKATKGKKFKGRKVTAVMPPDDVKIMLLTYKASTTNVDAEIVKMLSQRIEGDINDYVIDYLPIRNQKSDDEHIVMASVARRNKVERLLNTLTAAGLQVHSLDIGPAALKRLVSSLYENEAKNNVLLINIGENTSYLTIVSGKRLLFDQPVEFGCTQLLSDIATTLDISIDKANALVYQHGLHPATAQAVNSLVSHTDISATLLEIIKPAFMKLVEEINRVLIYTASETHGEPLSRVLLLGCIARWPGAQELMLSFLDIQVPKVQTEFYEVFHDADDKTIPWADHLPEMAIATGLALRGLQDD